MLPHESQSPLVSHSERVVNNTVLLAAAQLWQSTKTRCPKMDFIVEIPPCRPDTDSYTGMRGLQLSKMCTGRKKISPDDVERAGFHLLSSPLCVHPKKTNLLHRGQWKNAALAPRMNCRRDLSSRTPPLQSSTD